MGEVFDSIELLHVLLLPCMLLATKGQGAPFLLPPSPPKKMDGLPVEPSFGTGGGVGAAAAPSDVGVSSRFWPGSRYNWRIEMDFENESGSKSSMTKGCSAPDFKRARRLS